MAGSCFICSGTEFGRCTPPYRQCRRCGHETLVVTAAQAYMLNDPLSAADARRVSWLDRFQDTVLERFGGAARDGLWVDIGTGSGKYLARNRGKFARHCGVEITPAAVEFPRRELGLEIVTDIGAVGGEIAFATAWHSLEHFPTVALEALLARLGASMPAGARLVVSVPNGASFQYRLFRTHYAFLDVPAHLQQFTPDSLRRLLAAHGFQPDETVISWPYNVFGYAQGCLNLVLPGHNYLYHRLKRGMPSRSRWQDLAHLCLLPLVVPLAAGLSLLDAARPERQGVLTCCFARSGPPTSSPAPSAARPS
ncbi:MAG: class I SAM-dependent methyltransferase [Opitutae bacterium]|nr:class I SAM-dependent methyltransferase [Opitutae bacterium]